MVVLLLLTSPPRTQRAVVGAGARPVHPIRDGAGVRLFTRNGHDFTMRFPLAAAAVMALPAHSFLIDGEAIVTNDKGLAVFELIRRARNGGEAVLCAFDFIELEGQDLRRAPI